MSMDEFKVMISNTEILKNSTIDTSDVGSIFNVSMMTQVGELENKRHMEMSIVEFIEAI